MTSFPFPFPAFCVHGPHTPAPTTLCVAPQFAEALEALFLRAQQDDKTKAYVDAAAQELLALHTHDQIQKHPDAETILAVYAILRPFLVS